MNNYGLGLASKEIDYSLTDEHRRSYCIELLMINYRISEAEASEIFDYIYNKIDDITKIEDITNIIENNLEEIKKMIGDDNE